MPEEIFTYLEGHIPLTRHQHLAAFYRDPAQAFRFAGFLTEGLEQGDFCIYLAPEVEHALMFQALENLNAPVELARRAGRMQFHAGSRDRESLAEMGRQFFAAAEQAAAPGVRWLEEMSWPAAIGLPMYEYFEFEATLNYLVKHYPGVALCHCPLNRLDLPEVLCVLAVHRHLLIGHDLVRDNPFYIPAEQFIPLSAAEREARLFEMAGTFGFDLDRLLEALLGYGELSNPRPRPSSAG